MAVLLQTCHRVSVFQAHLTDLQRIDHESHSKGKKKNRQRIDSESHVDIQLESMSIENDGFATDRQRRVCIVVVFTSLKF